MRLQSRGYNCWIKTEDILGATAISGDTSCVDPIIASLSKFNTMFERFPLAKLPTYVKTKLAQPGTALLVTERTFPGIWQMFEQAKNGHHYWLQFCENFHAFPLSLFLLLTSHFT